MRKLLSSIIIIVLLFALAPSVFAANTLEVFEPRTWVLKRSIAVGTDSLIEDVYCEAYWCWIIDSTGGAGKKLQLFFVDWRTGEAVAINDFDIQVGAGSWGLTSCGGETLYVGDTFSEGMPLAVLSNIRVLDRKGNTLKNVNRAYLNITIGNSPQDLACNGKNLVMAYNSSAGQNLYATIDPTYDVVLSESNSVGRTFLAFDFNGRDYFTALKIGPNNYGVNTGILGLIITGVKQITNEPQGFFFDGMNVISARR